MNTVLWVFIALAFGLMLFVSLQDDIPQELSALKTQPDQAQNYTAYEGWRAVVQGQTVEMRKRFDKPTTALVAFLCTPKGLDARMELTARVPPVENLWVWVNKEQPQAWERGAGKNIFPPAPKLFAQQLTAQVGTIKVTIQAGKFNKEILVDTRGLREMLAQLPPQCR